MPVGKMRRQEKISTEEALQQWFSLTLDQRQTVMRFEDPALVERIRSGLQTLFEKQAFMQGILAFPDQEDPFESSMLLKEAFEFTWSVSRFKQDPDVVVMDPKQYPVLVMKVDFLQRADFVECVRRVLPDFFVQQSHRTPMPRARWKELLVAEPTSVAALERQLAKLVEQALWAMTRNPTLKTMPTKLGLLEEVADKFEPWMEKHDKKTAKLHEAAKKKNKKQKARVTTSTHTTDVINQTTVSGEEEKEEATPGSTEIERQVDNDCISTSERRVKPSQGFIMNGQYLSMPLLQLEEVDTEYKPHDLGGSSCNEEHCASTERSFQPMHTPPFSPSNQQSTWQPQQLVQYIWGQTSQFEAQESGEGTCCIRSRLPTASTRTPESSSEEPVCLRGQWVMPTSPNLQTPGVGNNMLRAVVRNTFIDVDVCSNRPTPVRKTSRSLSPSHLGISGYTPQGEDVDPWLWYWH